MQTQKQLRVVQVGCGPRSHAHIAAMLASGAIELVALCDLDPKRLQATGEQFGIARRYHDMAEMISQERPDLIDIVTPPTIRASIIDAAIAAGAPALLIEKPLALRPSEARHLASLGRDRLIAINTQYQWMPHWRQFWQLLRERRLGKIQLLRASTGCNLLEQGPHILDLTLKAARLSGLPYPEWVLAACSGREAFGEIPVPADTSATLGLGNARLHFNAGPSAPPVPGETIIWYQQQVEIIGERGRLWVSLNQGWSLWLEGNFTTGATRWPGDDHAAQVALFTQLRDTLHGDQEAWQEFPTRVGVAARHANVLFSCYASARQGKPVPVDADWPDTIMDG